MQTTILGRTGLTVSVAGLGTGGHSRLGLGTGGDAANAVRLIHAALDGGVNVIDTARIYGTEPVVGQALADRRDKAIISTKQPVVRPGTPATGMDLVSGGEFITAFEQSLQALKTDHVDILHAHGVTPAQYAHCRDELVPALFRLREQGKIRFLGLTERFIVDPGHGMLDLALEDDCWDVIMAGYSIINPSARTRVFPRSRKKGIGMLNMFAVRRVLADAEALAELIADLVDDGVIDGGKLNGGASNSGAPLGFVTGPGGAASMIEAAYRFCRHAPGVDVVLTGTGSADHLAQNLRAIQEPPLAETILRRLEDIFGAVDSVSGN